ncbi:hypothetical protein [Nocardioides pakistanensis]
MTSHPGTPDFAPIIEAVDECPDHRVPLLLVHVTDGSHLGYALNVLRARHDGDDSFAAQIIGLVGEPEVLRSAIELVCATVSGLVVIDCDNEQCDQHDCDDEDGCADPLANYGYLTALGDILHATPGQADLALLCEDIADSFLVEDDQVVVHEISAERALALAERLVGVVETRHGWSLDEQVLAYQRALATGA